MNTAKVFSVQIKRGVMAVEGRADLPKEGRGWLMLLPNSDNQKQWPKVKKGLGWLKLKVDPAEWEREIRTDWER